MFKTIDQPIFRNYEFISIEFNLFSNNTIKNFAVIYCQKLRSVYNHFAAAICIHQNVKVTVKTA